MAATSRVANIPSVISNVFLGIIIAHEFHGGDIPISLLALIFSCPILLYMAGNFLNDWYDHNWDQSRRPERALPLGLFQPKTYLITACCLIMVALVCAYLTSYLSLLIAAAITLAIIIYTWSHKMTPWSVIPMGLCRALLPILGYVAFPGRHNIPLLVILSGISLFCYIMALSLSARTESMPAPPRSYAVGVIILFLPAPLLPFLTTLSEPIIPAYGYVIGMLPYAIWTVMCLTIFKSPVSRHVSNLLAGIPFVDWIILLPLGIAGLMTEQPLGLICILLPAIAFISAKALQRLAPAT